MKRTPFNEMAWLQFDWQRPFETEAVTDLLTHLASHTPQVPIIFEIRGGSGGISYYLGVDRRFTRIVTDAMKAHGDIRFTPALPNVRIPVNIAKQIKITKPLISLNTGINEAVVRAGLAAMMQPRNGEQAVIQIVLIKPYHPSSVPDTLQDPHASWMQIAFGNVEPATAEAKKAVKEKIGTHGFYALVRIAAAGSRETASGYILSLLSALRPLRSAGVNIISTAEHPDKLNYAHIPWHFPYRLSVKELANFMMLPAGGTELPGVAGLHPKQLMPPYWYRNPAPNADRSFAISLDGRTKLSISEKDSREHIHIIGPTGAGKSTVFFNLIRAELRAGNSLMLIDPKGDLADAVISMFPPGRDDDLVIINPADASPCGFNPLAFKGYKNHGLIADAIYAVFAEIFKDNFGIRTQDVLTAALYTLARAEGSSLLWLPTLLTDKEFRKKITEGINDPIGLSQYWSDFEKLKDSEQRQEIAPVLNKVRQFLLRPGLRNILGQSNPRFDLMDLFTKPRVVLVPLNKGILGAESSRLLGALLVSLTWTLALSRAAVPENKRRHVSIFIDELQDYLALPTDLSDALAQARGLGVSLVLAHQFRTQLPKEILAGVDANARNKIVFTLEAEDAKKFAEMAPELDTEDFMKIPRYNIYTSFNQNGRNTGWISGKTLPPPRPTRNPAELKKKVAARYGKPGAEVEREYLDMLAECQADNTAASDAGPVGRRPKS